MKKLLVLMFLAVPLMAQLTTTSVLYKKVYRSATAFTLTRLDLVSYTAAETDTTDAVNIGNHTGTWVTLACKDSASILIKYQLSTDGSTWGALTTIDSLKQTTEAVVVKSVNLTATTLGAGYVRFVFAFSQNAYPSGTTTPKYSAYFKRQE